MMMSNASDRGAPLRQRTRWSVKKNARCAIRHVRRVVAVVLVTPIFPLRREEVCGAMKGYAEEQQKMDLFLLAGRREICVRRRVRHYEGPYLLVIRRENTLRRQPSFFREAHLRCVVKYIAEPSQEANLRIATNVRVLCSAIAFGRLLKSAASNAAVGISQPWNLSCNRLFAPVTRSNFSPSRFQNNVKNLVK